MFLISLLVVLALSVRSNGSKASPFQGPCGSDEICCFDPATGAGACRDMADDEHNCGGCGSVCEWDETCLGDVCALGAGLDCFETTCPLGTTCISDHPCSPDRG